MRASRRRKPIESRPSTELFRVEVTEGGKGYWKYYFRSLIGNHSTSMEATDALGCRYQLARWDRETEQELTSASPT